MPETTHDHLRAPSPNRQCDGPKRPSARLIECVLSAFPVHCNTSWLLKLHNRQHRHSRWQGYVVHIETGFLCTCNAACETNVWCSFHRDPDGKPSDPMRCSLPSSSTSSERTVVRDILTKEHRPRKTNRKCCRNRICQGIGIRSFFARSFFPLLTNFGCEHSGQCKKRLQPSKNAHLMKRVLDIV